MARGRLKYIILISLFLSFLGAEPCFSASQSFQDGVFPVPAYDGTRDNTMVEATPAVNLGTSATLAVDGDDPSGSGFDLNPVIKWDISSLDIPAGQQVMGAFITVNVTNVTNNTYLMYGLSREWEELESTWNDYSTGNFWQIGGANGALDRDPTLVGRIRAGSLGTYKTGLPADGTALVQSWVDDPSSNHGIVIMDTNDSNGLDFSSREAATPANRPKLTVVYGRPISPYLQDVTQTSVKVRWKTDTASMGTVDYGFAVPYKHSKSETVADANGFHEVALTGLTPGRLYRYRVTDGGVTSGDCSFHTAPATGNGFTFLAYGDNRGRRSGMDYQGGHEEVISAMLPHDPKTFILNVGDIVYDGSADEWQPQMFLPAKEIYKNNVLYVAMGNHEEGAAGEAEWQKYFDFPDGSGSPFYYSFDYGNAHIIIAQGTDDDFENGFGAQYNWFVADLASPAATNADWIIVAAHYPIYSTSSRGNNADLIANIEPLLIANGVDLYIAGHDHFYERSYKDGVYHIISGGGGAPVYAPNVTPNAFVEFNKKAQNFSVIEVGDLRININTYDESGTKIDTFSIPKTTTTVTGTLNDSKSGLVIPDSDLKLYNASGDLVAQTKSDSSGDFTFEGKISTGDYTIKIKKSRLCKEKEVAVAVTSGAANSAGTVLIDPFGVVFDSVTNEPIPGATVTLYTGSGAIYGGSPQPNPQTSGADGGYNFDVAPGTYYLGSVIDGYEDYQGDTFQVVDEIIEWNIPMDPTGSSVSSFLSVRHTVNKESATAGDIITYTLAVSNISAVVNVTGVSVQAFLPYDFRYATGGATIDGVHAADPSNARVPVWSLGTLNAQTTSTITYRVVIGSDARTGKSRCYASVTGTAAAAATGAGPSIAVVDVQEGLFCSKELVIGKVFEDLNGNGRQEKGEDGLSRVSLVMEDGKTVITDEHGRFSIPEVTLGTHILRLDTRVLPGGPLSEEMSGMVSASGEDVEEEEAGESLIERRTLGSWIRDALSTGSEEVDEDIGGEVRSEAVYRPEVPKVSRFFTVYDTQTTRVNIPVTLLNEAETDERTVEDSGENQFMFIGLADGEMGYLAAEGNLQNLKDGSDDGFENSFHRDLAAKFYLKGKVKGEYLITARYDSRQEYEDHLFEYIDPEKYYPIYGDGSVLLDVADSQGKFFLRLKKADSGLVYGNYSTEEFTQTELSKYGRTLHGVKVHLESKDLIVGSDEDKNLKLNFFGSETRQDKRQDILSGRGLSGPYFLSRSPIIEYTEIVRVQVRDRNRTDVVLSSQTMTLDLDYEIDYQQGRIMFKKPVPTEDPDGDLVLIVVDYEFVPDNRELDHYIAGVRGEIYLERITGSSFLNKVKAGSQYLIEQKDSERLRLLGMDIGSEVLPGLHVAGEWAHSDDLINKPGDAWRVQVSNELLEGKVRVQAYATEIDANFSNPVNVTESAVQKYGVTGSVKPMEDVEVIIDHYKNRSIAAHTFDRRTSAEVFIDKDKVMLGGGYILEETVDERSVSPNITSNNLTFQAGIEPVKDVVLSAEYNFEKRNEAGRWRQTNNRVSPRLDVKIGEKVSVYARHDLEHEETKGRRRKHISNTTAIGLNLEDEKGVNSYVEYGFTGSSLVSTSTGQNLNVPLSDKLALSANNSRVLTLDKNEENIGYGAEWEPLEDLFLNFLMERRKVEGAERYDSNSVSVTVEFIPGDETSAGVKVEYGNELDVWELNVDGNLYYPVDDSLVFMSRGQLQTERDKIRTQTNRHFQRLLGALAYRPVESDRFNMLAKYDYSRDVVNSGTLDTSDLSKHIVSLEAFYDLTEKWEVYGRYALKWVGENALAINTYSMTDLVSVRLKYRLNDMFDVAMLYHVVKNRNTETMKQGVQAEAGVLLFDHLRVAAGWNFMDYEDDELNDENYKATGPYLNCSFGMMEGDVIGMKEALVRDNNRKDRVQTALLREKIKNVPKNIREQLNSDFAIAEVLFHEGQFKEAKKIYDRILDEMIRIRIETESDIRDKMEEEKEVARLFRKAEALYGKGRYVEALEVYKRIAKGAV